jgi:hypothetical protein
MEKIGIDKICQHIERQNSEKIELAREKGIPVIPYTADDFSNDASVDCFISSAVTVKSKWKALKASGIVVMVGDKTCIDVSALSRASNPGVKGFARGCA